MLLLIVPDVVFFFIEKRQYSAIMNTKRILIEATGYRQGKTRLSLDLSLALLVPH